MGGGLLHRLLTFLPASCLLRLPPPPTPHTAREGRGSVRCHQEGAILGAACDWGSRSMHGRWLSLLLGGSCIGEGRGRWLRVLGQFDFWVLWLGFRALFFSFSLSFIGSHYVHASYFVPFHFIWFLSRSLFDFRFPIFLRISHSYHEFYIL